MPVPASVFAAGALVVGVYLGSLLPLALDLFLAIFAIWLAMATWYHVAGSQRLAAGALLIAIVCLGVCRWQLVNYDYQQSTLKQLAAAGPSTVQLQAKIESVPVVSVRPTSEFSPRLYGASEQTQFIVEISAVYSGENKLALIGKCQVYVDGNAAAKVSSGDVIRLTGKLDWPGPPANPGEFNFQKFLERHQISGLIYVKHPQAIEVLEPASCFETGWYTSRLRRSARSALITCVDADVQAVALALLLGNRHQLPAETEQAFIASGTMHLLAISGLHVGILCLFLMQVMNALIVPRRRALLLTALICWGYAMVTDLRPSVVRAAVFFSVFVVGQLAGRNQRTPALIAVTALLMLIWAPNLVFETGAWLSFLSVAALGCVARRMESGPENDSDAPADAITFAERLKNAAVQCWGWIAVSYWRMFFILAVTTPLVVSTFHVVSPIGLVVNIFLIPATTVTLCFGFVTMFTGMLMLQWPAVASVPGIIFSGLLRGLVWIVESAAKINVGHTYVPDVGAWFIPCYYMLLISVLLLQRGSTRNLATSCLLLCLIAAFWLPSANVPTGELRCTVLSVGHGNAVVIETAGGRVLLVDSGAMNRGGRTAELVCRYLWTRGVRRIDGIIVSHADMDHYNAVADILTRIPVGELMTSADVLRSESASMQAVVALAEKSGVHVHVLRHGDHARIDGADLTILQADSTQLKPDTEDNERSLVVRIDFQGHSIVLPGDLEGVGADHILPNMKAADVLMSPHHGSRASNTEAVANAIHPTHVIVSGRDTAIRKHLELIYAGSKAVYFTAESGAITATLGSKKPINITTHLPL